MLKWPTSWGSRGGWYRWALPVYWIVLFCATHYPQPRLPGLPPQSDKVIHFGCFGLLAFFFWKRAESGKRAPSGRFVWVALAVLTVYAVLDEYLQRFVNRHVSLADGIADVAGVMVVLLLLELRRRRANAAPPQTEP